MLCVTYTHALFKYYYNTQHWTEEVTHILILKLDSHLLSCSLRYQGETSDSSNIKKRQWDVSNINKETRGG